MIKKRHIALCTVAAALAGLWVASSRPASALPTTAKAKPVRSVAAPQPEAKPSAPVDPVAAKLAELGLDPNGFSISVTSKNEEGGAQ